MAKLYLFAVSGHHKRFRCYCFFDTREALRQRYIGNLNAFVTNLDAFEQGTTKIAATGGYSNAEKTVIYFVVNRFQISKLRNIVRSIDPKAYLTIHDVADIFKGD
ncbi:MAG: YitT family protein [Clostridia bacterium]|nr:YitT family protein [Clostridia bacterium]